MTWTPPEYPTAGYMTREEALTIQPGDTRELRPSYPHIGNCGLAGTCRIVETLGHGNRSQTGVMLRAVDSTGRQQDLDAAWFLPDPAFIPFE